MSRSSLVLHPADPWSATEEIGAFRARLGAIGLIGSPIERPHDPDLYAPGCEFHALIEWHAHHYIVPLVRDASGTLREREPVPSWTECTVGVRPPLPGPVVFGSDITEDPRCPACRVVVDGWQDRFSQWWDAGRLREPRYEFPCATCGRTLDLGALDWRHTGGFGRQTVEIVGVRKHEAVPTPRLLGELEALGLGPWTYHWSRI